MTIRETINRRPGIAGLGVVIIVAIAAAFSLHGVRPKALPGPITQAFYSNDDGQSYFADALGKPVPFDHDGTPAYRAYVYRCENSSRAFVGYLARQVGRDSAAVHSTSTADAVSAGVHSSASTPGTEVKRPGDHNWVGLDSAEGAAIVNVTCPDGGRPLAVLPGG